MLVIKESLRQILSTLTEGEKKVLAEDIQKNGCLDPLKVCLIDGEQVLIDGHNRYEICSQFNIPYQITIFEEITTIEDAEEWILRNQLGRRNLNDLQRSFFRGTLYNRLKKKHGGDRNPDGRRGKESSYQNDNLIKSDNTSKSSEKIAKSLGVGTATINRDAKLAQSIVTLEEAVSGTKTSILDKKIAVTKEQIIQLATVAEKAPETIQEVIEQIKAAKPQQVKQIISQAVKVVRQQEQEVKGQFMENSEPVTESDQPAEVTEPVAESDQPAEVTEPVAESDQPAEVTEPVAESDQPAEVTEPVAESDQPAEVTEPVAESDQPTETTKPVAESERPPLILNTQTVSEKTGIETVEINGYTLHIWYDGAKKSTFNTANQSIDWAWSTWNPVTGCLHSCNYCYARDIATSDRMKVFYPKGFEPVYHPYRLDAPSHTKHYTEEKIVSESKKRNLDLKESRLWAKNVFVCSMADLFGKWVPDEWILSVFDSVKKYNSWNYLFLTKYPQRLQQIGELLGGSFPDNCWVGTTVDEQKRVKIAQNAFANIKAPVKWLSLEPLLTNLEFTDLGMFDMVAIGGQSSNSQVSEFQPKWEWVENILWQARKSNTSVYFKENLKARPKELPF